MQSEIQKLVWLNLIREMGGYPTLAKQLGIPESTLKTRVDNSTQSPIKDLINVANLSGYTISSLSNLSAKDEKTYIANQIAPPTRKKSWNYLTRDLDNPWWDIERKYPGLFSKILIDADGALITGLALYQQACAQQKKQVQVIVLDLEAWLKGSLICCHPADYFNCLERIAISCQFDTYFVGQSKKSQLFLNWLDEQPALQKNETKKSQKKSDYHLARDATRQRKDTVYSELLEFSSRTTFQRMKHCCFQGNETLLKQLRDGILTAWNAEQLLSKQGLPS